MVERWKVAERQLMGGPAWYVAHADGFIPSSATRYKTQSGAQRAADRRNGERSDA